MTERDKEYYNQKISELYAVIENQEKIIRDLQERNSKAIEYVENNTYSSVGTIKTTLYLQNDELYDLLEISKGGKE